MAKKDQLNNQWSDILSAGTHDGETYTVADLDNMVREYGSRGDADKAPVGLGTPQEGHPETVGRIDALRRVGNSLQGRFSNVDPRVEHLYGRGSFSKTSVQVKRSPDGDALQRVGLISPTFDGKTFRWRDDKTPSLEELYGGKTASKDHIFAEAPLGAQWLELFRAGDYGNKGTFTNSDLDQVVKNFDPSFHEPPVVIGHPENDAPAYGWVDGLKREDNVLLGRLKQVDPKFEEMVKAGRFKKRSVSFYQTGKGWMLRHVGFLGALPPEVKGLANARFNEDRIRFVTVIFGEAESGAEAAITRLKKGGYWIPLMDRYCFSEVFRQLEDQPVLGQMITFIETTFDALNIDPNGARLCRRAKQYASFHGVAFGEALDRVLELRAFEDRSANHAAPGQIVELSERAKYIARSRGVSFGGALDLAVEENPELLFS